MVARLSGETVFTDVEAQSQPGDSARGVLDIKEEEVEVEFEFAAGMSIQKVSLKGRLQFFTWNWFTAVMAAGGNS